MKLYQKDIKTSKGYELRSSIIKFIKNYIYKYY